MIETERNWRIIADSKKKNFIQTILLITTFLFIACVLIGTTTYINSTLVLNSGPSCMYDAKINPSVNNCSYLGFQDSLTWNATITNTTSLNSYFLVRGQFFISENLILVKDTTFNIPINTTVFDPNNQNETTLIRNEILTVYCYNTSQICGFNTLLTYQGLSFNSYAIQVKFDLSQLSQQIFDGIYFTIKIGNSKYNLFVVFLRGFTMILSIIGLINFIVQYRQIPSTFSKFEHNRILILSIFLVLFNDPLYFIVVLRPSVFWDVYSTIVVQFFYFELLLFWIKMTWKIKDGPTIELSNLTSLLALIFALTIFSFLVAETLIWDIYTIFQPAVSITKRSFNKHQRNLCCDILFSDHFFGGNVYFYAICDSFDL